MSETPETAQRAAFEPAACPNPIVQGAPQYDLGPGFECGYLTVPENRAGPTPTIV